MATSGSSLRMSALVCSRLLCERERWRVRREAQKEGGRAVDELGQRSSGQNHCEDVEGGVSRPSRDNLSSSKLLQRPGWCLLMTLANSEPSPLREAPVIRTEKREGQARNSDQHLNDQPWLNRTDRSFP